MWSPVTPPPLPAPNSPSASKSGIGLNSTSVWNMLRPALLRNSWRWILVLMVGLGIVGTLRPNFTSNTEVGLKMWFHEDIMLSTSKRLSAYRLGLPPGRDWPTRWRLQRKEALSLAPNVWSPRTLSMSRSLACPCVFTKFWVKPGLFGVGIMVLSQKVMAGLMRLVGI